MAGGKGMGGIATASCRILLTVDPPRRACKALQHAGTGGDKAHVAQSLRLGCQMVWGFRVSGTQQGDQAGDPTSRALARLEEAVDRLAEAAAQPRAPAMAGEGGGEGVPRAAVAAIADRLDETIARLRAALGEDQ